eukprot:6210556-Pleurochrysis_carterae.AAC.1
MGMMKGREDGEKVGKQEGREKWEGNEAEGGQSRRGRARTVEEKDEPPLHHGLLEEKVPPARRPVDRPQVSVDVVPTQRVLLDDAHEVDRGEQKGHELHVVLLLDAHDEEEAGEGGLARGSLANDQYGPAVALRRHFAHHDVEGVGLLAHAVDEELDALQHDVEALAREHVHNKRVGGTYPVGVLEVLALHVHRRVEHERVVAARQLDLLQRAVGRLAHHHVSARRVRAPDHHWRPHAVAEHAHAAPARVVVQRQRVHL